VELESGEVNVGQNICEDVVGKVLDMIGLEMEWTNVELEGGKVNVRQNSYEDAPGKLLDMIRPEMEWSTMELDCVKTFVGENMSNHGCKMFDVTGLEVDRNYDMERNSVDLETGKVQGAQKKKESINS
jgi:hypothetical protein